MATFQTTETLPQVPDNLSLPQFFLDYEEGERIVNGGKPVRGIDPSTPLLIEDATGRRIGPGEIRSRTFGLANALSTQYNIRQDDVVLIFSRNHVDYLSAIWAVHRLGGVISGANPDFSSGELLYQLHSSKASLLFVHPDALETALEAARSAGISEKRIILFNVPASSKGGRHRTVEDLVKDGLDTAPAYVEPRIDARTKLAFLSYSSGTTGKPKAVAIPHFSVIINVIQMAVHHKVHQEYASWEERRYRPGDVAIGVLPFYHIYGLVLNLHFILYCRMTIVVVPKFNFVEMLRSIARYHITHLMLVPPQVILLLKHPAMKNHDLSSVRFIMVGAAPLSNEVSQQLFDLFPNAHIGQAYGMTETCTSVTAWPINKRRGTAGSAGLLEPGIKARILKPDGSFAGYDEPGELCIFSPSNALRYHNNEQATKETFIERWVRTGDEAKIDRNLELWILDRIKEIMKVRGFQVAPAELEGCILDHPDVNDACVVGIPDEFSGEIPLAFVVLNDAAAKIARDPVAAEEIKASIKKHVADNKIHYKHLAGGVAFVPSIPKNPSGKLLRRVLRDKAKEWQRVNARL